MEQVTLKYLRVVVPGVIFLLGFYPIYQNYYSDLFDAKTLDFSYLIFLSVIAGAIFYQLNFQYLLLYPSHVIIIRNIRKKLIEVSKHSYTDSQITKIRENVRFLQVFYHIIDNNESLKKKAANVYFNGIFWTSTVDSVFINGIFWYMYKYEFTDIPKYDEYANVSLIFAILSLVLHVISVIKHIALANDQFEYMKLHNSSEVKTKLDALL